MPNTTITVGAIPLLAGMAATSPDPDPPKEQRWTNSIPYAHHDFQGTAERATCHASPIFPIKPPRDGYKRTNVQSKIIAKYNATAIRASNAVLDPREKTNSIHCLLKRVPVCNSTQSRTPPSQSTYRWT